MGKRRTSVQEVVYTRVGIVLLNDCVLLSIESIGKSDRALKFAHRLKNLS